MMVMPQVWNEAQVGCDTDKAMVAFKESRVAEPERVYLDAFWSNSQRIEHVLDVTDDLLSLAMQMPTLLADGYYDVVRYLSAPPISEDDLYVVAGLSSRSARSKLAMPENVAKICDFVNRTLDAGRFGWVRESRRATEIERRVAVVSTAALLSTQQVQTGRRTLAKRMQEGSLKRYLVKGLGYKEVPTRRIRTAFDAPKAYEFCGETPVVGKKADVVVGLGDNRFMCVECKVSNSTVNSFKRLNHETVEKAVHWYQALGRNGIVCAALLSGVYSVDNVMAAQGDGVSIFWSHDLGALGTFVRSTYPLTVELQ